MGARPQFRPAGDPRTRKRMPNPSIELAADAPAATFQLRYVDASGEMQGPFPIKFDPEAALLRDQRKILDMTATSCLSFREFNGLLVYYTHLMSYRCAIREVRVGIDNAAPDKVVKLPPCNINDPSAIPNGAMLYQKLPPATQFMSVELTCRDGSESEIKTLRTANRSNNQARICLPFISHGITGVFRRGTMQRPCLTQVTNALQVSNTCRQSGSLASGNRSFLSRAAPDPIRVSWTRLGFEMGSFS